MPQLVDHERDQEQQRDGDLADRSGIAPADSGRLHECVDEQQHPAGDEDRSEQIEVLQLSPAPFAAVDQPEDPAEHEHGGDRVDEHHPAPAGSVGQKAPEQHAGGGGEPPNAAPHSDRGEPILALSERGGEDRERGREHHRGTNALQQAGANQDGRAAREPSDHLRHRRQPGRSDAGRL